MLASVSVADARIVTRTRVVRVVRIPLRPFVALPTRQPIIDWKESRAPKCILRGRIAAATVNGPRSLDLIMRNGARLRAKLQKNCAPLDYYSGFYLKPSADGKVCQDRDAVHSRSGGACEIDAFRKLTPAPRR